MACIVRAIEFIFHTAELPTEKIVDTQFCLREPRADSVNAVFVSQPAKRKCYDDLLSLSVYISSLKSK